MFAAFGVMAAREPEIHQGIEVGVGYCEHMATTATVATIGTAKLFVFFMPKRDAARPTVSSRDINIGFVNELHGVCVVINEKPRAEGAGFFWEQRCRSGCSHVYRMFVQCTLGGERNVAFRQRKQGVILADADIGARVELGAALTHDDRAAADQFAAKFLHAEHFGLRIAPVSR